MNCLHKCRGKKKSKHYEIKEIKVERIKIENEDGADNIGDEIFEEPQT